MGFWKTVLSQILQETDSETEICVQGVSQECEVVREAGFGKEGSRAQHIRKTSATKV